MSIISALLRFARKVVESVAGQLMQQINTLEEQVRSPIQAMVQEVTGGVWIGRGANAFVEEVSSMIVPGVGQIGEGMTQFHRNIQHAVDVIDQADEQVSSMVNGLADTFGSIF